MRVLVAAAFLLGACVDPAPLVSGSCCPDGGIGGHGQAPGPCTKAGLPDTVPDGPPPIAGGTLLVLPDGTTAVAADPDSDVVWIVDTAGGSSRSVALMHHDEPGRLALDGAGKVHVVLRRAGAVVTIDPASASIVDRTTVCPAPRGIAYDAGPDLLHVACVGGELVSLHAAGGTVARKVIVDSDLRDVLVINGKLMVSRFRSAEVLTLAADGTVVSRTKPGDYKGLLSSTFTPSVAWRTIATPSGGVAMVHQRTTTASVNVTVGPPSDMAVGAGGYGTSDGNNCNSPGNSVVQSTVSVLSGDNANSAAGAFGRLAVVVDLAVTPDGSRYTVVTPATANKALTESNIVSFPAINLSNGYADTCNPSDSVFNLPGGQPVALAAVSNTRFIVQMRAPAAIVIWELYGASPPPIPLDDRAPDEGHLLFHSNKGTNIACASCHPEGGDDGRVWHLDIGDRRTMSLRGGLRGTEPFHWKGEDADISALMTDVFTGRMNDGMVECSETRAIANWLESIPPTARAITDAAAVARGQALFNDGTVGCSTCHDGAHFTNNATVDVGTGDAFQVPRLVELSLRAPYLHDGRAATLLDRFDPALGGGDQHGKTSQLSASQLADLVAYLESL